METRWWRRGVPGEGKERNEGGKFAPRSILTALI